jgi:hypothetical protein
MTAADILPKDRFFDPSSEQREIKSLVAPCFRMLPQWSCCLCVLTHMLTLGSFLILIISSAVQPNCSSSLSIISSVMRGIYRYGRRT